MDQGARRQKNASEAEVAFKERQGQSVRHENQEGQKKENKKIGQEQQQEKQKGNRRSKLEKDKKFTCKLCGLSYFYKQGLSKHKQEPFHKAMNKNKRRLKNNEIFQYIQTEEKKMIYDQLFNFIEQSF